MKTNGRIMQGKVTSNKMQDTIVVKVERWETHPLYGKILSKFTKVQAHDANNECQIGDVVNIQECRPISKCKSWALLNVVEKAR